MPYFAFFMALVLTTAADFGLAFVLADGTSENVAVLESFRRELDAAHEVAGSSKSTMAEWQRANDTLVRGMADPRFAQLEESERGGVFAGAGWAAMRLKDAPRARDMFSEATRLDPETTQNWARLAGLEADLGHHDASAKALAVYLKRLPDRTKDSERLIFFLVERAEPGSPGLLELLQVLFGSEWRSSDPRNSEPWRRLALERIRRGETQAARAPLARVSQPDTIVRLRIDKRFDGLFDPQAPQFDPVAAAHQRVDELKVEVILKPTRLKSLVELTRAMLAVGMYDAVIEISDGVLKASTSKFDQPPFEDPDEMVWVMNNRATALLNKNQFDEALAIMENAAATSVDGRPNVNQTLNLAGVYCDLGRGKDTLAAAARAGEMSDYGRMAQVHLQHCGALLEGDEAAAAISLDYLRKNRAVAERLFLPALIRANRMDEAAKTIIERLESEATRSDMLFGLQEFNGEDTGPKNAELTARWDALMARADVRRAVERVGRRERFDYYGAAW